MRKLVPAALLLLPLAGCGVLAPRGAWLHPQPGHDLAAESAACDARAQRTATAEHGGPHDSITEEYAFLTARRQHHERCMRDLGWGRAPR